MQISEAGLIAALQKQFNRKLPVGVIGIGDDCAVMPQDNNKSLLVTTDLLIEGTHFLRDKISAKDLGYKAIAVNLSDIAAMGGVPKYAFVSAALPKDISDKWIEEFIQGMDTILTEHQVLLLGGDTAKSGQDIFINVAIVGEAETQKIKYRSAAKAGDIICVTGNLGDAKAGLECILRDCHGEKFLLQQHLRPQPQIEEGLFLAAYPQTHAMMDISDGINLDLQRLQQASNCGVKINLEKLPISKNLSRFAEKFNLNPIEFAAIGGEDYCLLVTIDADAFKKIAQDFQQKFKCELIVIGEITSEKEFKYFLHGKAQKLSLKSFSHFHEE